METAMNGTFARNSTEACELSPHASFFSTVLLSFTTSIISGASSISSITACMSPLPCIRIVIVSLWHIVVVLLLQPVQGGEQWFKFARNVLRVSVEEDFWRDGFGKNPEAERKVSALGWASWLYAIFYAPTTQVLWLIENWNQKSGFLMILRGTAVSLVALPLTMDTKARYGEALGKHIGGDVTEWIFSLLSSLALGTFAVVSSVELIFGIFGLQQEIPKSRLWLWAIIVLFIVLLSLFWAWVSFHFTFPLDKAFSTYSKRQILTGIAMGCVSGIFVAAPSFVMMLNAARTPGLTVWQYARCQSVAWWRRAIAILP